MTGKPKKNNRQPAVAPVKPVAKAAPFASIPQWAPFAVGLFTALLYSNALQNALTSFDDDFYLLNNPYIKDFTWKGVKAIFTSFYSSNYHPFTTLTYLLEYHWFALNPLPYHLLNVVLHVANTYLVFRVAEQLSGKKLTGLIVSLLFAVHPMHVESVAWVSERKDVLYTCFFLLSLLAYMRYTASGYKPGNYILSLLLFVCSVNAKAAAVSLPVLFIVVDIYQGRKITLRSLLEKAPFLALSLVYGILNILAQAAGGSINNIAGSYGFINRVFLFTSAIASYILHFFVPYHLSGMHYFPAPVNGFFSWEYYLSLPFVALVVWLAVRRSALRRELVFGSVFFLVTIFLMLQVVSVGSALIAERYTYVAYIGLFYIFAQWVSGLHSGNLRNVVLGAFAVVSLLYAAQSWQRIGIWKDDTVLFDDMIEKNPNIYFGYWMRGNFEKRDGNLEAALQDYNKAISLNATIDDSYYNRGNVLDALGNTRAAISDYTASIKLNPKLSDVYNNRGWAYFKTGDTARAIADLDKAIALKPDYFEAYNNRGWVYNQSGNLAAAEKDYNKALSINPGFDRSRFNRASLKGNAGDFTGALADFDYLVKHHQNEKAAFYYRGYTYLALKDTAAACSDFNQALSLGNQDAGKMISRFCNRR